MSRHLAVLRQFLDDSDRLQRDVEIGFRSLGSEADRVDYKIENISQETIMQLYRPVHSLKSIVGMVDEGKPLLKVFHEIENCLPPLLKGMRWETKDPRATFERLATLIDWSHRYLGMVREKLLLCYRLGVELKGEIGISTKIDQERVWVPLSSIQGILDSRETDISDGASQWFAGEKLKASFGVVVHDISTHAGILWIPNSPEIQDRSQAVDRDGAMEFSRWLLSRSRAA